MNLAESLYGTQDTREELQRRIWEALERGGNLLVTTGPGTGKTTLFLEYLRRKERGIALYSTPYVTLSREVWQRARGMDFLRPVTLFYGRQREQCSHYDEVEEALSLGYPPRLVCERCEEYRRCAYYVRRRTAEEMIKQGWGVIFCTHDTFGLFKRLLEKHEVIPAEVVVDDGVDGLWRVEKVPVRSFSYLLPYLKGPPRELVAALCRLEGKIFLPARRWEALKGSVSIEALLQEQGIDATPGVLAELAMQVEEVGDMGLRELWKRRIPIRALEWLKRWARGERVSLSHQGGLCACYLSVPELPPAQRYLLADATAFPSLASRLVPKIEVLKGQMESGVELFAVVAVGGKRTLQRRGRAYTEAMAALRGVAQGLDRDKVAVFTHKSLVKDVEVVLAECGRSWEVNHFWAPATKGTNTYASFEAMVVLGVPRLNPLTQGPLLYGLGAGAALVWEYCEHETQKELRQVVGRLRAGEGRRKLVVFISDMPDWRLASILGVPKDKVKSYWISRQGKIERAAAMLLAWWDKFRFVTLSAAELLGAVAVKEVEDVKGFLEWMRELRKKQWWHLARTLGPVAVSLALEVRNIWEEGAIEEQIREQIRSVAWAYNKYIYSAKPPKVLDPPCVGKCLKNLEVGNQPLPLGCPDAIKGVKPWQIEIVFKSEKKEMWRKIRKRAEELIRNHEGTPPPRFMVLLPAGDRRRWVTALGTPEALRDFCLVTGARMPEVREVCDGED